MAAETQSNHGTTESTEAAGHGGGGLPQLRMEVWGGQIFWLLIIFVILYVALSRLFNPRLRKVIDERAETIATAIETARKVQSEAEDQARAAAGEVAEARAQSQRVAAEARAKAASEAAERSSAAEAEVSGKVAEAEGRISAMRESAMANVGAIATDTASAIVEKLTGKAPSATDVKAALAARGGAA